MRVAPRLIQTPSRSRWWLRGAYLRLSLRNQGAATGSSDTVLQPNRKSGLKRFVAREIYNALIDDHRLRAAHLDAA